MLTKFKEWWGWVVALVVGIIGALVYMLKRKEEQLDSANARNNLHEADKESAIIDTKVRELEKDKESNAKEIDKADTEVVDLQTEKAKALEKEKNRKPDEVEDYWNK